MKVSKNILYVIKNDRLSEKAIKILESSNITFQSVIVGFEGTGKFMWRDTRTIEIPALLTANRIYRGLQEISNFVHLNYKKGLTI